MITKNKKVIYDYTPTNRVQVHPYELLANAIVEQAVSDYRALKSGRIPTIGEEDQLNMKEKEVASRIYDQKVELAKFFASEWCATLTKVNTEWMFEKLRKEQAHPWKPTHRYVRVSADNLMKIINDKGLSYNRVEQLTGVKGEYIFRILRGEVIIPVQRLKKLAKGLGVEERVLVVKYITRREDLE